MALRLDSVGYLPDALKIATSPGAPAAFSVLRSDGSVAFSGQAAAPVTSDDGEQVAALDFSGLTELGAFLVHVDGVGDSAKFRIEPHVYDDALKTVMLGFQGARCGTAITIRHDGESFSHAACHRNDAYLDVILGTNEKKDSLFGWHDAGDYGKYTVNGAFSAGMLLKAWEHFQPALADLELGGPNQDPAMPDFLEELKFELDWLLTTQFDDGRVSHKVTAKQFEPLDVAPERDLQPRLFAPTGTAAAADLVAVLAQAARIYKPYAPSFAQTCLDAALKSYAFLTANPSEEKPDLSEFKTGGYQTSDQDDRIWAAAEVWETTGDAAALADFEARAGGTGALLEWDWSNLQNLGIFTYLLSERTGRDPAVVAGLEQSVIGVADEIVNRAEQHAYGRGIGPKYYWGINGTVARVAMNLSVADRLSPKPEYAKTALLQIDHLFGRNPYARSFVTGVGFHPPEQPHHRPSVASGAARPWPGLLVGGPWPGAADWHDAHDDFKTNEVAINWSAALAYALAGASRP